MSTPPYMLYLDSAADPGWLAPYGKSPFAYYILGGIALRPQTDEQAQDELNKIKNQYFSKYCYAPNVELKYSSLISGLSPYDKLQKTERKALADDIFNLIINLNPTLFATVVDKNRMKTKYGSDAMHPKDYAFRATANRFSMFLKNQKTVGYLIMDTEEYKKDKALQDLIYRSRQWGINICGFKYQPQIDRLERCLNTITFVPSEMSSGIQLADFCVHTVFRHFERKQSNRFNQISHLFNRGPSRFYDPSVVPK